MQTLAIDGGEPVRQGRPWPAWPEWSDTTIKSVVDVVRSGRWTVSWPSTGRDALEREFAEQFAQYNGASYGVAVDHGSGALVVALEMLGIGAGDEVIVPVMTWVASASAVLRVAALPVLVDVDPSTGCLDPEAVRDAMSPDTRAIIAVHLASTVADLDALRAIADEHGVPLIEDCAQAHGARWRQQMVGTVGEVGAFSFQQSKVLAAGEGGAVITSDPVLYHRAQQLRADSRGYSFTSTGEVAAGAPEIVAKGDVIGTNFCMAELQAAILIDLLPNLDAQHERREVRARELREGLATLGSFCEIPVARQCDRRSIYEYGIRFTSGEFGDAPVDAVSRALSAELQRPVRASDIPLHRSPLFRPETARRLAGLWTQGARHRALGRAYPGAEGYRDSTLLIHHSALLGTSEDIHDVIDAVRKVQMHSKRLALRADEHVEMS